MNRGILATEYASLVPKADGTLCRQQSDLRAAYEKYYKQRKTLSEFCRDGVCPETKWVEGSNYVDVEFQE